MNVIERFWAKVSKTDAEGCWLWTGSLNAKGYGAFTINRRFIKAHHVLVGRPPKGLEWDHLCRVRNCVRDSHLELVTHAVNVRRGNVGINQSRKTECIHGHPYTAATTMRDSRGHRQCLICFREAQARWNSKRSTVARS